ncbi:hypothetical protein [Usitatibacter palustris]|uniref:hypothetical protein n=1 Tax=Usitatibacter palustris TaxID=2732487 RepID=UPI00148A089A|nr:hypothetical protein [Usitatibacter palustris]
MYEVHVFRGKATVGEENSLGYAPGGRHAIIVFSRQARGEDHDFALATERAVDGGLAKVVLDRGGTLLPEAVNSMSPQFGSAFENALDGGFGVIVYEDPIEEDEDV